MDAQANKTTNRIVSVRQGETIKLSNDRHTLREITCDDIARLALAMHDHRYFFSQRRGLSVRFSRDLNGSGTQGLYITKEYDETETADLIRIVFAPQYKEDGDFLYESDLITDRGKDHGPTVNQGKHRFVARWALMQIDWNSDEAMQWRSDCDRLSRSTDTLSGWIEADLKMLVRCSGQHCSGGAILAKEDLARHVAAGLSIKDLQARLTCSKCGKRGARVMAA